MLLVVVRVGVLEGEGEIVRFERCDLRCAEIPVDEPCCFV